MRLRIVLPKVKPEAIPVPTRCASAGCGGRTFHLRQQVAKALRDTVYQEVRVHRYQCLRCKRTFRVYPQGTTNAQTSQRVKGLAVMLYLLGLSYGAVSLALEGLGVALCKSRVYDGVQEVARRVPGLTRDQVFAGVKTPALGGDLTSVKCKGEWLPLGITVDPISGLALTIDALPAEDIKALKEWIEPIAKRVDAQVLVTDDADVFKTVADEVGLQHQVCKAHVLRNTETLIERYQPLVARDADGSLQAIGVSREQATADLTLLARTGQESRAGAGHGSGNHASALCASNAPARGRASEFGLSSATLISRSMEPVASFDALPQVERVQRGNARWDQQCL